MENYIVSARKYRRYISESFVGQHALTITLKTIAAIVFSIRLPVLRTAWWEKQRVRIFCQDHQLPDPTAGVRSLQSVRESCLAFNEQRSYSNIHELDYASNNSVEDIRSLIEQVRIPPNRQVQVIYH